MPTITFISKIENLRAMAANAPQDDQPFILAPDTDMAEAMSALSEGQDVLALGDALSPGWNIPAGIVVRFHEDMLEMLPPPVRPESGRRLRPHQEEAITRIQEWAEKNPNGVKVTAAVGHAHRPVTITSPLYPGQLSGVGSPESRKRIMSAILGSDLVAPGTVRSGGKASAASFPGTGTPEVRQQVAETFMNADQEVCARLAAIDTPGTLVIAGSMQDALDTASVMDGSLLFVETGSGSAMADRLRDGSTVVIPHDMVPGDALAGCEPVRILVTDKAASEMRVQRMLREIDAEWAAERDDPPAPGF